MLYLNIICRQKTKQKYSKGLSCHTTHNALVDTWKTHNASVGKYHLFVICPVTCGNIHTMSRWLKYTSLIMQKPNWMEWYGISFLYRCSKVDYYDIVDDFSKYVLDLVDLSRDCWFKVCIYLCVWFFVADYKWQYL